MSKKLLGPHPLWRAIVVAVPVLLLINTVVVVWQEAPATGQSTVLVDGESIAVEQDGPKDAPALVLIHGTAASIRSWDLVVPQLAQSHRVIRIDMLGHGRSAKPTGTGYSMDDQGRRIGQVLDRLGVSRAVVVGHSTGGSVATALAEQRRDLVAALAFINTGPNLDAAVPEGFVIQLLNVPVLGQLLWRLRTDFLLRQAAATAVTRDVEIPQSVIDDVRAMTYHSFTAMLQAAADYLRQRPLPDRLAGLGTPLLVISGTEDRRWRSSAVADYRIVPGVTIETLPGIGHSPLLEDPSRTADLLLAFAAAHATT